MKVGDGTRRRSGCLECRRRKRRCDEHKPVCLRCAKTSASCTYPDLERSSTIRLIISRVDVKDRLPKTHSGEVDFINLASDDLPRLCSQYPVAVHKLPASSVGLWTPSAPQYRPSSPALLRGFPSGESVAQLIQYYFEVISISRVYVSTERNLFRSTIMPFLFRSRGPLLFAVIALSSMERGRLLPNSATDYDCIAHEYKAKSLSELQDGLVDPRAAEENLMTCVLQASLEITGGSQPTWLLHLRGALAILKHFHHSISPEAARFASQYFYFRYTLLKTTESPENDALEGLSGAEMNSLMTAMSQASGNGSGYRPDQDKIIDEHLGCSLEMVETIFHISEVGRLSKRNRHLKSPQSKPRLEFQRIHERLQSMIFFSPEVAGDYLLKSATCFKLAAELYLRLTCSNIAIDDPIILRLEEDLLASLSQVITNDQPRRSFPMWPLFIAGCASINDEHRKRVLLFFRTLDKIWPISNISTIAQVVWTIWQTRDLCMHPGSDQRRDWQEIIHKFGWKLALS